MSQVALSRPIVNYLDQVLELALFDVLVKIVMARRRIRRPRAAFVGSDPHLLGNLEAIHDSLIDFSDPGEAKVCGDSKSNWRMAFNCYEGKPGDGDRPSRALAQLSPEDYDVIVVSDGDPGRESALRIQVGKLCGAHVVKPPLVVSFGRLRTSVVVAMQQLREDAYFTCLNARKTATVAIGLFLSLAATGCVVECGTYLGGTSILMGLMLRQLAESRRIHTFDTFEGLPIATAADGTTIFQGGAFTQTSLAKVTEYVRMHGLSNGLMVHKGLIQEELPKLWAQENQVAFCFSDSDQFAGTEATLATVVPRLHPQGLILVDDYFEHGVQRAVGEALAAYPDLSGGLVSHSMYMLWHSRSAHA